MKIRDFFTAMVEYFFIASGYLFVLLGITCAMVGLFLSTALYYAYANTNIDCTNIFSQIKPIISENSTGAWALTISFFLLSIIFWLVGKILKAPITH